jgi:carbamoyl-phosphate synthase large subunit
MNLLFSCIGKQGHVAEYFRSALEPNDRIIGTGHSQLTPGFKACDRAFLLPAMHHPDYGEHPTF